MYFVYWGFIYNYVIEFLLVFMYFIKFFCDVYFYMLNIVECELVFMKLN